MFAFYVYSITCESPVYTIIKLIYVFWSLQDCRVVGNGVNADQPNKYLTIQFNVKSTKCFLHSSCRLAYKS